MRFVKIHKSPRSTQDRQPPLLVHWFICLALELFSNETTPHFVRLPNRVQIPLRFGNGDALIQYAIKKHERRDPHVGRAMHKHPPLIERLHHSTESSEILRTGRFEIHRDMDISHTKSRNHTPFVCHSVVRCRQSKIDNRFKASLPNHPKLSLCRLPSSAQSLTNGTEIINFRHRCWKVLHRVRSSNVQAHPALAGLYFSSAFSR